MLLSDLLIDSYLLVSLDSVAEEAERGGSSPYNDDIDSESALATTTTALIVTLTLGCHLFSRLQR